MIAFPKISPESVDPREPEDEDRLQARIHPPRKPVMFQSWQHLLFLHWAVPPEQLAERLPPGLHLDTYDGQAWLGIVPFFMKKVRPSCLPPVPGISNFLELNVRTYVFDDSGVPGVWFFSLDASSRFACSVARRQFHLPYRDAHMSAKRQQWIDYDARRRGKTDAAHYRYRGTGGERLAEPGSLDFFLLERYVLYAFQERKDILWRGRVHHEPYRIRSVELDEYSTVPLRWDQLNLPGSKSPAHSCLAERVDVKVFNLRKIKDH